MAGWAYLTLVELCDSNFEGFRQEALGVFSRLEASGKGRSLKT